jgi:predicted enzyme related to lactoylglutathione lyase
MEKTAYAPGTPSWVDVGVPDLDAAAAFYGGLFGWDVPEGPIEMGGYRIATLRGKAVAGFGSQQNPGPPTWATYVATADLDATTAATTAAGGAVVMEAMEIPDQGRMAVFQDDAGTFFSSWQTTGFAGCELVNEPGALSWNELTTRNPAEAKAFYGSVFGWTALDHDMGEGATYTEWQVDGTTVAGMMPMVGDMWPADLPNHWMVYFAVDDTDAAAARAAELGGVVMVEPFDIQQGRIAVLNDPAGTAFSVITLGAGVAPT